MLRAEWWVEEGARLHWNGQQGLFWWTIADGILRMRVQSVNGESVGADVPESFCPDSFLFRALTSSRRSS